MFERMQMDPNLNPSQSINQTSTTLLPATTVDIETVWHTNKTISLITEQLICPLNNSELACDLYEACMANFSSFYHELQHKFEHDTSNISQSNNNNYGKHWRTSNKLKELEFVIGLFFGIILGATVMYVSAIVAKCCQTSVKRHRAAAASRRRRTTFDHQRIATTDDYSDIRRAMRETTYPIDRPRTRRRAPLPPPQISNEPSFLASLFQRRRRYTTNLVRRLSQSRLFLARQNSSATNTDTNRCYRELDTQRLIDVGAESQFNSTFSITGQRLAMASEPSETNLSDRIGNVQNENVTVERAETPPPAYIDVV